MELVPVGKLGRTHGLHGELKVRVEEPFEEDFLRAEVVFVETARQPVPYFIEQVRGGGVWLIKFEEVNDLDTARPLQQKAIYLKPEDVRATPADEPDENPYLYLTGFQLIDDAHGPLGPIEDIMDLPQHSLAILQIEDREILVPLHEDLIVDVDREKKIIRMRLPEGLL